MPLPEIRLSPERIITGIYIHTCLAADETRDMWRRFMPRRNEISNRKDNDLISVQLYDILPNDQDFSLQTVFTKWAAAEVNSEGDTPDGMSNLIIQEGLYAVFLHIGGPSKAPEFFTYVFRDWLPSSGYQLDNRPHFEILGARYSNTSPDSEEEIWIPVKSRT